MTTKETLYLDDALVHAKFMTDQCREAERTLQDATLKAQAKHMAETHSRLYGQFYNVV